MKNNNTKKIVRYCLVFIGFGIVAFFAGFFSRIGIMTLGLNPRNINLTAFYSVSYKFILVGYPILSLASFLFCLFSNGVAKKMVKNVDDEDEEAYEKIDRKLGFILTFSNLCLLSNMAFFSIFIYLDDVLDTPKYPSVYFIIGSLVVFLLNYVWIISIQSSAIMINKEVNPEKESDIVQRNFGKKWMESCDEAEKALIYERGYRAFKAGVNTCMAIWCISSLSMIVFGTGILPVLVTIIIYMVLLVTYSSEIKWK